MGIILIATGSWYTALPMFAFAIYLGYEGYSIFATMQGEYVEMPSEVNEGNPLADGDDTISSAQYDEL